MKDKKRKHENGLTGQSHLSLPYVSVVAPRWLPPPVRRLWLSGDFEPDAFWWITITSNWRSISSFSLLTCSRRQCLSKKSSAPDNVENCWEDGSLANSSESNLRFIVCMVRNHDVAVSGEAELLIILQRRWSVKIFSSSSFSTLFNKDNSVVNESLSWDLFLGGALEVILFTSDRIASLILPYLRSSRSIISESSSPRTYSLSSLDKALVIKSIRVASANLSYRERNKREKKNNNWKDEKTILMKNRSKESPWSFYTSTGN